MTRKFDNLGPYIERERAYDAAMHGFDRDAGSVSPDRPEGQLQVAAQSAAEAHAAFLASPESGFLGGLSDLSRAAEDARACYCRGFGNTDNIDAAWRRLTAMQTAMVELIEALGQIDKRGRT